MTDDRPPDWWFNVCGTWSQERLTDLLKTADKLGYDRNDWIEMKTLWEMLNT